MKTKRSHKTLITKKKLLIAGCFLAVLILAIVFIKIINPTNPTNNSNQNSTNLATKESNNNQSTNEDINSKGPDQQPAPAPVSTVVPDIPTGTFVSNHHPNMSGSPAPNTETSTCTTTPGARCQIRFTHNDTILYLPSQLTDADGSTSWSWTLQEIGLTSGTWKVAAIATNGNKTSIANDVINLEINK